jgi:hypothetical protein
MKTANENYEPFDRQSITCFVCCIAFVVMGLFRLVQKSRSSEVCGVAAGRGRKILSAECGRKERVNRRREQPKKVSLRRGGHMCVTS